MEKAANGQHANGSGIGQPVRRREDFRLVRGAGRYTADENLPGQVHAFMLRSPHAHARLRAVAIDKAQAMPGVLAVLTGADFVADGLKPIPHKPWSPHPAEAVLRNKTGAPPFEAAHWPLPTDKARFVGEAVAMVVAETVHAAKDGAEAIEIDYEALPAVVETVAAARQDAPHVHDSATNICFDSELGDAAVTATAFARAAHVTRFETWVQRVTGVPMEPRAALAEFDRVTGRFTVYAGNGGGRGQPVPAGGRLSTGAGPEPGVPRSAKSAGASPRLDAGRRRQFRHARHDLSGIRARGLGSAQTRPPGQMDHRAQRVVFERLSGARPCGRG